ncbi:hypothetical protein HHX47_DHR2000455 [Lentinula edodes]|nr:hypothetical protein HHX47_DHR2000455 [Lentinula edodes]
MSSIFQPELPPGPHQKLARYRQLSSRSSVHVSPLCLGGMSIGDQWSEMFGSMDKESSFKLLDTYYDAGGNWIDTANIYQEGSSEEFIGEWMEQRDIRSQMIIATKGISNAPAWLVVKANDYARSTGKTPFVVYQAPYSILKRDIEREILPMCQHEGIALTLYFVLAAGHIRTTAEEEQRRTSGEQGRQGFFFGPWERTPDEVKVCDGLEKLAAEIGVKNINALYIIGPKQADLDRICGIYNDASTNLKSGSGGKMYGLEGDISSKTEAKRLAEEVAKVQPYVTVLFNNAGIQAGQFVPPSEASAAAYVSAFFDKIEPQDFNNVLNTNAVGAYWLTFAFLPLLEKWKNSDEEVTKKFVPQMSLPGHSNEAGIAVAPSDKKWGFEIPTVKTGGTKHDVGALALCLITNWFINGETVLIDGGTLLKHPSSY